MGASCDSLCFPGGKAEGQKDTASCPEHTMCQNLNLGLNQAVAHQGARTHNASVSFNKALWVQSDDEARWAIAKEISGDSPRLGRALDG